MQSSSDNAPIRSRSGILSALLICIALATVAGAVLVLVNANEDLQDQITQRDDLIERMQIEDSLYRTSIRNYDTVVHRFISNCKFTVDGKEVTPQEIIKLFNDGSDVRRRLIDSLEKYYGRNQAEQMSNYKRQKELKLLQDSVFTTQFILGSLKKHYGLTYQFEKEGNTLHIIYGINKVDSALILFPYHKSELTRDTVKGQWIITRDKSLKEYLDDNSKKQKGRKRH